MNGKTDWVTVGVAETWKSVGAGDPSHEEDAVTPGVRRVADQRERATAGRGIVLGAVPRNGQEEVLPLW